MHQGRRGSPSALVHLLLLGLVRLPLRFAIIALLLQVPLTLEVRPETPAHLNVNVW